MMADKQDVVAGIQDEIKFQRGVNISNLQSKKKRA